MEIACVQNGTSSYIKLYHLWSKSINKNNKKKYRQWLTTYLRFHFILLVGVNFDHYSDMESAKSMA